MTDLSGDGVRILVLATATHSCSTLPSLATVRRSFEDLTKAFVEKCGASAENVVGLLDPPDARAMATVLAEEAARARSVLVVYFIGHGLRGPGGELFLAAVDTDELVPGLAAHQALSFAALAQAVQDCRAPAVVVILDCCFSGTAGLAADTSSIREFASGAYGRYLIGSAEHIASAPAGHVHTAFTGALLRLLTEGDPRGPAQLSVDAVFDGVYRLLRDSDEGPLPRRQAGDRAGDLIIAANPAATASDEVGMPEQTPGRCPYPGLAPYGPEDAGTFFGREAMVERVCAELSVAAREGGMRVLVGASGAGKTSLLNAGIIAALRATGLPGISESAGRRVRRLTPGTDPLQRLAAALEVPGIGAASAAEPDRISALVDAAVERWCGELPVLVVDQLEELFTLGTDSAAPSAFVAMLAALAAAGPEDQPRAVVLLALRADFYGHAAALPEVAAALSNRQILIEPMTRRELREVIEKPAAAGGWSIADGWAELILNDLGPDTPAAASALPLLSHVLSSTWRNRSGKSLTAAGYHATGGIAHAIKRSAEAIYTRTDRAGRDALRAMLLRLVRVGADGDADTAQPADREALTRATTDPVAAQRVLDEMIAERLITSERDTVRLSHEALVREWPRLREWIDADRDRLGRTQRFLADSREWQRSGYDRDLLYRGTRLASLDDLDITAGPELVRADPIAADFLAASVRAQRRRRNRRTAVLAMVVVLLIAAGAAVTRAVSAEKERDALFFASVLAEADRVQNSDPTLAAELDVLAQRLRPGDPQVVTRLLASTNLPVASSFTDHTGAVSRMRYLDDGHLVTAGDDHALRIWNSDPGTPPTLAAPPIPEDGDRIVALTAHAHTLISGGSNGPLHIRDISDPTHPRLLSNLHTDTAVVVAAVSADGRTLAIATTNAIEVWNITDPTRPARGTVIPSPAGQIETVGFAGSAAIVAQTTVVTGPLGQTTTAWVWPVPTDSAPTSPKELAHVTDGPLALATSPDNPTIAVAGRLSDQPSSGDARLRLFDLHDPSHPDPIPTTISLPSDYDLEGIALSRNARVLATVTSASTRLWNLADPAHPTALGPPLTGASPCRSNPGRCTTTPQPLTMTADATQVAIGLSGGVVQRWSVPAAALAGQAGDIQRPAVSADGTRMLTVATGAPAHFWDIADPAHPHLLGTIGAPTTPVHNISGTSFPSLSRDGRLAMDPTDGIVTIYDISDPTAVSEVSRFPNALGATFMPNEPLLVLVEAVPVPEIIFWDYTDPAHPFQRTAPQVLPHISLAQGAGLQAAASPDDELAAALTDRLQIWDVQRTLRDHAGPIGDIAVDWNGNGTGLVISRDNRTIVAGWDNGTIQVFDIGDPKHVVAVGNPIQASSTLIAGVALAPDGRFLATGGTDSTVRLFDFTDPRHPTPYGQSLAPPGPTRWQLAFHPRPGYLIGTADQGTLRIWDLDPDHATARTCALTGPTITDDLTSYRRGHRLPPLCP